MALLSRNRVNDGMVAWPYRTGIDNLFDQLTRGFEFAPALMSGEADLTPTLDVSETAEEWRARIELPGIAPEDVEVSVTGNVLTVRGEKKCEPLQENEASRRCERRYGKFVRSLEFPSDVDAKKVEARFRHGVLTVALPKAEAAKPRTVAIKVE